METGSSVEHGVTLSFMRLDMREDIYSAEWLTMVLRSSISIDGREPILENRDAIVDNRFTSLSISATISGLTPESGRSSSHAMSDDMGVPS